MDYDDPLLRLTSPQRNHYFFGKMMGVAQFEREQRYMMHQRWLLNRLTVGTGVLCGLEVTLVDNRLRVACGVAIDGLGREIVVARPVDYDPFQTTAGDCGCTVGPAITAAGDYVLCLSYRECTTDDLPVEYSADCLDQPDCLPDTTVETFALGVRPAKTVKGFVCGEWTAPDASDPSKPPTLDMLRDRLIEQFGARCAAPTDVCVPLKRIKVTKDGAALTLSIPDQPRTRIHTQAELLEMILCLAKCCADQHPDTTGDPIKVDGVRVMQRKLITSHVTPAQEVDMTRADTSPPAFSFTPGYGSPFLLISFTWAVESSTLPSALLPPPPDSSVTLDYDDLQGGGWQPVPVFAVVMRNATVIQIERGISALGRYKLTLYGDEIPASADGSDPGRRAIKGWKTGRRLDGEPTQLPSGDDTDGGNFTFVFDIVGPAVSTTTLRLSKVWVDGEGQTSLATLSRTYKEKLDVVLDFNGKVAETTLQDGISWKSTNVDLKNVTLGPVLHNQDGADSVPISLQLANPRFQPDPPKIQFTLSGSTLLAADGTPFNSDPNLTDPAQLPTGDEMAGGPPFSFTLVLNEPPR